MKHFSDTFHISSRTFQHKQYHLPKGREKKNNTTVKVPQAQPDANNTSTLLYLILLLAVILILLLLLLLLYNKGFDHMFVF